jgi:hypothetical protein
VSGLVSTSKYDTLLLHSLPGNKWPALTKEPYREGEKVSLSYREMGYCFAKGRRKKSEPRGREREREREREEEREMKREREREGEGEGHRGRERESN